MVNGGTLTDGLVIEVQAVAGGLLRVGDGLDEGVEIFGEAFKNVTAMGRVVFQADG